MFNARKLRPLEIPHALQRLGYPPKPISVAGDFSPTRLCVAIVGSRDATPATIRHARRLAALVVDAGGVVISGGANGTDAAAHRGTIDVGGRTWCVLACSSDYLTPREEDLDDKQRFSRIIDRGGAIIWPYPSNAVPATQRFLARNKVIMALANAAIVVQAGVKSGSLNAASHAKKLGKPLWVVPGIGKEFAGSWQLIEDGARVMRSEEELIDSFKNRFDGDARRVLNVLGSRAKHPDQIVMETGLSTSAVATALLTLALGDVVVEGSAGMFQRK
jgi:DNA processing protein